jgi:hypothetical protein
MQSKRETFVLKLINVQQSEQEFVSIVLKNVKSMEVITFNSPIDLANYLENNVICNNEQQK